MTPEGKQEGMLVRSGEPFNAGPPPSVLAGSFLTPSAMFFVRNHGTIPAIDPQHYRLLVRGAVTTPLELSLNDLRARFEPAEITATLQCAGNRRAELMAHEAIPGEVPWELEAISTARWRGVRLRDVLAAAAPQEGARHAAFLGLDDVERHGETFGFGGSIPLDKALSPEVLLAFEMNGAPLLPTHGFPLRVVAPGYIGARSVKWLASITLQAEPSENYFQAHAYKLFPPDVRADTADWSRGVMLGPQALNATITTPEAGAALAAGEITVRGFALPSAGAELRRVEVSGDGGRTWREARMDAAGEPWAWGLWEATLRLEPGQHQLVARAWDTSDAAQPEDVAEVWNFKGYMNNAWHRVTVNVGR